jgi:LytS/YehU family sensor histidine kinase
MIRISASRHHEVLTLRVCNDGPERPVNETGVPGVGNANVRSRLRNLYGDAFEFTMRNAEIGGVEVSISLPYTTTLATELPR